MLDVGCGDGRLSHHLPDGEWVGVDASLRALASAPQPSFAVEATALPFPDASFGSVALLHVLGEVERPRRVVAEARRVLTPGGLVAVAVAGDPELEGLLGDMFEEVAVERWHGGTLAYGRRR